MARKKQTEMDVPGIAPVGKIDSVEVHADDLRELKAKRRKLADDIKIKEQALIGDMKNHNLTEYRYRDSGGVARKVVVENPVRVRVKTVRKAPDDSEGGEGTGEAAPAGTEN